MSDSLSDSEEISSLPWSPSSSPLDNPNDVLSCRNDDDILSYHNSSSSPGPTFSSDDGLDAGVFTEDLWVAQLLGEEAEESEGTCSTVSGPEDLWAAQLLGEEAKESEGTCSTVSGPDMPSNHVAAVDLGGLAAAGVFDDRSPVAPFCITDAASCFEPPVQLMHGTQLQGVRSDSSPCTKRGRWSHHNTAMGHKDNKELAICPICAAPADVHARAARVSMSKFANYIPRAKIRQDNRLGKWYAKYGYCGPDYCRQCAESFNSHLLKTPARSKLAACTRGNPCTRCTAILGHFDASKEEVFSASDGRNRRPRKKQKQKQKQSAQRVPPEPGPPASPHLRAGMRPFEHSVESEKTLPLLGSVQMQMDVAPGRGAAKRMPVAIAAVVVVAVCWAWESRINGWLDSERTAQPSDWDTTNGDENGWICGAAAAELINSSVSSANLANICENSRGLLTFPCDLNDCGDGQVPIGERTCRCDGCFHSGGRCAGWALQGYGLSPRETGCKSIQPDPNPYIWTVPGDMSRDQCTRMCGEVAGCYRSETRSNLDPKCEGEHLCELAFSRPWPEGQVNNWGWKTADNVYESGTGRSGVIWTVHSQRRPGGGTGENTGTPTEAIWYNTIDDGGQIYSNTNVEYPHGNGTRWLDPKASPADLHLTWKFDSSKHGWQALPSSLTVRPGPRIGAAHWVDSTGALFLLGGLSAAEIFGMRGGIVPFSNVEGGWERPTNININFTGLLEPTAGSPSQLWRYDTNTVGWQPLHVPGKAAAPGAPGAPGEASWPMSRVGVAVWRDRADESRNPSTLQTKIWMFGGWTTLNTGSVGLDTVGNLYGQLWQYVYEHELYGSTAPAPGRWTLVLDGAGGCEGATQNSGCKEVEPLLTCVDATGQVQVDEDGHLLRIPCPSARKDAGSWPSTNGAAGGWVFGGIMELERGHISSLNDLWHWNGDLENPLWAQKIQQQTYTSWPPQWQAPSGWASDADGGELWLAGDSGKMHDIEVDVTKAGSNPIWRFSVAHEKWDRYQISQATGAGLWPAARSSASVASGGVMFGGILPGFTTLHNDQECMMGAPGGETGGESTQGAMYPMATVLSGLWQWEDDTGTVFYQ